MSSDVLTASEHQAVVRAAEECFNRKGMERTTYAQIASVSGVDAKRIKAKFRNKPILALEVQIYRAEQLKRQYLAQIPDAPPRDAIKFILRSRIDFIAKSSDRTMLFFINAMRGKQPWTGYLDKLIWQFSIEFASLIERGIREGNCRKDTEVNVVVRALTSVYLTGVVSMGLRGKEFDADLVWRFIEPQLDFLFDSIQS